MFITCLLMYISSTFMAINGNLITEGSPYTSIIQPYETQQAKFSTTGGLKRVLYYQCTGTVDLAIVDESSQEVESFKDFVSKDTNCAEDTLYTCLAEPCTVSTCPNFPKAECVSNYCGGCNAIFKAEGDELDCGQIGSSEEIIYTRGAPPHMAVLQFKNTTYTFNTLGKRSNIDDSNTFLLYVFNNKDSDGTHAVLDKAQSEVTVQVTNDTVALSWLEPENIVIKQYCIYHKATQLGTKLHGSWLACGHEVKNTASALSCGNGTQTSIHNLTRNSTHYIWVVAYTTDDVTTAYPFVRIDLETPLLSSASRATSYLLSYLLCAGLFSSYLFYI